MGETPNESRSESWPRLIVGALLGALAAGAVAIYLDWKEEERADEQAERAKITEVDRNVYFGEAPLSYYERFPQQPGVETYVIENRMPNELRDVWIEGQNNTFIRIEGIQPCTLYDAVHKDEQTPFPKPIAVHFTVVGEHWRKTADRTLDSNFKEMPEQRIEDDGSSNSLPIENCGS